MKLILTTLNAKYTHSSLALRYLRECCNDLQLSIMLMEFTINQQLLDILGQIEEEKPDIIGFSCYIWNIEMTLKLIALLKKVRPGLKIICGGPEISYLSKEFLAEHNDIDYLLHGEGEETLHALLQTLLSAGDVAKIKAISQRDAGGAVCRGEAAVVNVLDKIPFPYREGEMAQLKDKIIYYESSRGCPFACQYCLSSATRGVRFFSVNRVIDELQFFIRHAVRQVKFVDRTFNAKKEHYLSIWRFLATQDCQTNFHFEIAADILDEEALGVLEKMPKGRIQLEIGVQSTNELTLTHINRNNHWEKIVCHVKKLSSFHNMHLHLDLIIGLPLESYRLFQRSFNDVYMLKPDMLQLGFLKMLQGAGIRERVEADEYIFMDIPPYQVLGNKYISYEEIRMLQIFEEVFEQYYNSGRFRNTTDFLIAKTKGNAFCFYERLTMYWRIHGLHLVSHSVKRLYEHLFTFCQLNYQEDIEVIKQLLKLDALTTDKASILPEFLPWSMERYYDQISAFWRSDKVVRYVPDFKFVNWRELKKEQRIEMFDLSLSSWQTKNEIIIAPRAYLFSYTKEEVTFCEIKAEDFA